MFSLNIITNMMRLLMLTVLVEGFVVVTDIVDVVATVVAGCCYWSQCL